MLHMPARYGNKYMYASLPAGRNESSYINIKVGLRFRTSIPKVVQVDPRGSMGGSTGIYVGVTKIFSSQFVSGGPRNFISVQRVDRADPPQPSAETYFQDISLHYLFNGIMERLA